jgi:hypothetical protein
MGIMMEREEKYETLTIEIPPLTSEIKMVEVEYVTMESALPRRRLFAIFEDHESPDYILYIKRSYLEECMNNEGIKNHIIKELDLIEVEDKRTAASMVGIHDS